MGSLLIDRFRGLSSATSTSNSGCLANEEGTRASSFASPGTNICSAALGLPSCNLTPQVTPLRSPLDTSLPACFLAWNCSADPVRIRCRSAGFGLRHGGAEPLWVPYQGDSYSFKDDTASFGGGAFYNFPIHSRLTAGIDGRVLYGPASYGAPRRTSPSASALFPRVFACGRISRLAVEWSVRSSTLG